MMLDTDITNLQGLILRQEGKIQESLEQFQVLEKIIRKKNKEGNILPSRKYDKLNIMLYM